MKTTTLLLCVLPLAARLAAQTPAAPPNPEPPAPPPTEPGKKSAEAAPVINLAAELEAKQTPEQIIRQREVLTTWTCFSMKPAAARKAVIAHPKQADLFKWCAAQALITDSGVKMDFVTSFPCRSGQRSKLESNVEYPYPTESDPGSPPPGVASTPPSPKADPTLPQPVPNPVRVDPGMIPPPPPPAAGEMQTYPFLYLLAPWPMNPATPQSFESKILGRTIEVEVNMGNDGRYADLNISPEDIKVLSVIPWSRTGDVSKPVFATRKLSAQIMMRIGEPTLAGTLSHAARTGIPEAGNEATTTLLFVTVTLP